MKDCLFCKIVNGEVPSKTIYENDYVKAILDVNPTSNGHILIIPKDHRTDFMEIENELMIHINEAAKHVRDLIYNALNPDGIVLIVNYGLPQEIKHYHLHLIPTYKVHQELLDIDEVYKKF